MQGEGAGIPRLVQGLTEDAGGWEWTGQKGGPSEKTEGSGTHALSSSQLFPPASDPHPQGMGGLHLTTPCFTHEIRVPK